MKFVEKLQKVKRLWLQWRVKLYKKEIWYWRPDFDPISVHHQQQCLASDTICASSQTDQYFFFYNISQNLSQNFIIKKKPGHVLLKAKLRNDEHCSLSSPPTDTFLYHISFTFQCISSILWEWICCFSLLLPQRLVTGKRLIPTPHTRTGETWNK